MVTLFSDNNFISSCNQFDYKPAITICFILVSQSWCIKVCWSGFWPGTVTIQIFLPSTIWQWQKTRQTESAFHVQITLTLSHYERVNLCELSLTKRTEEASSDFLQLRRTSCSSLRSFCICSFEGGTAENWDLTVSTSVKTALVCSVFPASTTRV